MEYTKAEIDALNEKDMNPNKTVYCPRCGNTLEIKDYPSARVIFCKTQGCIKNTLRGF